MKILFLLLFAFNLIAMQNYSVRVATAVATDYDFGEILSANFGKYQPYSRVYSLDGGYLIYKSSKASPLSFYLKSGLSYFEQSPKKNDIYEFTLYLKAFYNLDFMNNRVRIGFGEGGSYTSTILEVERADALAYSDNNSHYLNYLDVSLDFDLGRLVKYDALKEFYIGALIKHRSGIFGLINNVRHGGSNHVGFYLEENF